MPKVSVLMPVYNGEEYIAEAIDSIIGQTFTDWELLIGDDGSSDNTEAIVNSFINKYPDKIFFHKNSVNRGHTITKYELLPKSTGEYIVFLDADDVSMPDRFAIQVEFLDKNPEYGLCGSWGTMIDRQGQTIKGMRFTSGFENIRCILAFNTALLQSSIIVRRKLMEKYYLDMDILLVEDYNFECIVSRHTQIENLPLNLVKYRWHSSNISNTKQKTLTNLNKKIYKRELSFLGIDANENELNIHNAIRDKDAFKISNPTFFTEAKKWLQKLQTANNQVKYYDKNIFDATICFKWIFACKERGEGLKCLSLPIKLSPKGLLALMRMLIERLF